MHNCEHGVPPPAPPTTGAALLLELGQLIVHTRDPAAKPAEKQPPASPPSLLQAKLLAARSFTPETPSTSREIHCPLLKIKEAEGRDVAIVDAGAVGEAVCRAQRTLYLDQQLKSHVQTLWSERAPLCISVLLANCVRCGDAGGLLLERWTLRLRDYKNRERPGGPITSQWLLNAVRSQLHFSQISAWRAKLRGNGHAADPQERQRRLSRETCNYKKLESNCDEEDLVKEGESTEDKEARRLNVIYRPHALVDARQEFSRAPAEHRFPLTLLAQDLYLEVVLESLPRSDEIPQMRCACVASKRRPSLPPPHDELASRLSDLSLGPHLPDINSNVGCSTRKLSMFSQTYQDLAGSVQLDHPYSTQAVASEVEGRDSVVNYLLLDDRMHTPCSESGKHRCSCDDESDAGRLDERRLRELAKYKRRMRKESRMRRLSGPETAEPTTSIPILQASRFDRMRALGCYRARAYVPVESPQVKRMATVSTQTDDLQPTCGCGRPLEASCDACRRRLVRSEASYDLAKASRRRERDESDEQAMKKHKCDDPETTPVATTPSTADEHVIKRPKLRRAPVSRRIERIVFDRNEQKPDRSIQQSDDIDELLLRDDDSVFAHMAPASPTLAERSSPPAEHSPPSADRSCASDKRSSSTDDEYVLCDYGTFDRHEEPPQELPKSLAWEGAWESVGRDGVPSPREMEGFRWRLDSAASMVFHARTGLPLTSSPAPLRRGKSCFDYDSSITGISGIKSALFHPVSPPEGGCWSPGSSPGSPAPPPAVPTPAAAPRARRPRRSGLNVPATSGLLGSFEESALNGRLEPVATVHGFTAELGASGAFCPPHRRLPVTVFFYALGGTNAPYLGHINLGPSGYRVPRSGTIQVSLLNPHGTLVKMFVVLYDLTDMPPSSRTFLRQRTLYLPCDVTAPPPPAQCHRWLRYLIHLRFVTSKSGKLYLHTDIRIIVSRKADLDTATAHVQLYKSPASVNQDRIATATNCNGNSEQTDLAPANHETERGRIPLSATNHKAGRERTGHVSANHKSERGWNPLPPTNHKTEGERTGHVSASHNAERQKIIKEQHNFNSNLITNKVDEKAANHSDRPFDSTCNAYKSAFVSGRVNRVFGGGDEEMSDNTKSEAHASSSRGGDLRGKEKSIGERYASGIRLETSSSIMNVDTASESGPNVNGNRVENVSYELRSFTYAPENPKYSPR